MNKRILSIILSLLMGATVLVSLFSFNFGNGNTETEAPTGEVTDVETESGEIADESDTIDETNVDTVETTVDTEKKPPVDTDTTPVDTDAGEEDTDDPGTTKCEHPYAATHDGHWKPACDVCGKPAGSIQQHDYDEKVEDEGDLLLYSLRCKVCKFRAYEQEVPYEINGFYSAGELAYTDTSGNLKGNFGFGAGMGLPNMKKNTDSIDIDTRIGVGTKVTMVINL